jgi:chromosome segregation ATPase
MEENRKGLFRQIQEYEPITLEPITKKSLERFFNKMEESRLKCIKETDLRIKENMKHLRKRSEELNKPIPDMLLIISGSRNMMYVGSSFINEYKEWL